MISEHPTPPPLSATKQRLLERLRSGKPLTVTSAQPEGPRRRRARVAPMSFSQEQIWLALQASPKSSVYTESVSLHCHGQLDVDALRRALTDVISRHESWRTTFDVEHGQPVQVVQPVPELELPVVDLSDLPRREAEQRATSLAEADAAAPMDLARGPLLRFKIARLGPSEHWLLLTLHHLIFDGVTLYHLFLPELEQLYQAHCQGLTPGLPQPALQYGDYAAWQRESLTREVLAQDISYWQDQLSGAPRGLALPYDKPRPARASFAGSFEPIDLGEQRSAAVRDFSRRHGVTLFAMLLTGFGILLRRYTGQQDLTVGSVSAGRDRGELGDIFGCFINPLPLRLNMPGPVTVREALALVRNTVLDAQSHDAVPFEMIVGELGATHRGARNPVFDVLFVLEPPPVGLSHDWEIRSLEMDSGTAKFDLSLVLEERVGTIRGRLEYGIERFERTTARRLLSHWLRVLDEMMRDPDQEIDRLPLLSREETRIHLVERNRTEARYPDLPIHTLFEEQAASRPDAIALLAGERSITYAELNSLGNAIAQRLTQAGVSRGASVAIHLERTPEFVASMLGALKAGAAYLPLDLASPLARLQFIVDDAAPAALIGGTDIVFDGPRLDPADIQDRAAENSSTGGSPDDAAYIMYTSGSTGQPKGVAATHRGITRLVFGADYADFGPERVFLHGAPVCFDISAWEVWGALLRGGRCALAPDRVLSSATIRSAVQQHGVDTAIMTASLFNSIVDEAPDALRGLQQVIVGGEPLSPAHVHKAFRCLPGIRLINGYGPTECGVLACCYQIPPELAETAVRIPIGGPIANTRVYVLDALRQPVPDGAPGELYLGGDGVAKGYVNRPALTAERFTPDPFSELPNARMYRTGDLVRYGNDELLEFLGRIDSQVKIRGYRIELGEIEAVLALQPGVEAAAVIAREDQPGHKQLAAYVVPGGSIDPMAVLAAVRQRLPEYMVPASITLVEQLPLGPTGKLNAAALPEPGQPASDAPATLGTPRDETELAVLHMFRELLRSEHVSPGDNFFSLGGDSLLAVRLLARIGSTFAVDLPLSCMWEDATAAYLADLVRSGAPGTEAPSRFKWLRQGAKRPFFCVAPLDGNPFRFAQLAQHCEDDRPFVALKANWTDEWPSLGGSVESVAASYLAELRQIQASGPYLLGGYSFGGAVAYELARQLAARGEDVALLAMIDCGPSHWGAGPSWRSPQTALNALLNLPGWASEAMTRSWRDWRDSLREELAVLKSRFQSAPTSAGAPELDQLWQLDALPADYREFLRDSFRALIAYVPGPYTGSLTLLRARSQSLLRPPDRLLGWGSLVSGAIHKLSIPGTHLSALREPNVRRLAALLNGCLQLADSAI